MTILRAIATALFYAACGGALADDGARFAFDDANDFFASSNDRHFTQGFRVTMLSSDVTSDFWSAPFALVGHLPGVFDEPGERKIGWTVIGQSLFTPSNIARTNPSATDRPYAGWLYTGVSLLQQTGRNELENFEILGGVVGPDALGRQTQNDFHEIIQVGEAQGWNSQLKNEPGLVISYERKYRLGVTLVDDFGVDIVPEAGVSLGNVLTYGEVTGLVRFGQNLGVDYGPSLIRPSPSGTNWFDGSAFDGWLAWSVYAGFQGRAIARNIFLDGNSFTESRSVHKKPLVADQIVGATAYLTPAIQLSMNFIDRTKEFYGRGATDDHFGELTIGVTF